MFTKSIVNAKCLQANCDDCGQHKSGVRFQLGRIDAEEVFLCWEHFRMTMQVMYEAGIVGPDAYTLLKRQQAQQTGCPNCHCDDCCSHCRERRRSRSWSCSCSCCCTGVSSTTTQSRGVTHGSGYGLSESRSQL